MVIATSTCKLIQAMTSAMPILADSFLPLGINPEVLHRVCSFACLGLDSLPHNGLLTGLLQFTLDEMLACLTKHDIPHSHVCPVASVHTNPQALANNIFEYTNLGGSKTMMVVSPMAFGDNCELETHIPYGRIGEHTVGVLKRLGYSDEEIDKMLADGSAVQHA